MFHNYFIVALRNLQRQFSYSVINIAGLAIGIACSLVMFLFVYNEWSYDRHFNNADRIYRVSTSFYNLGPFAFGQEVLGDVLPKEFEGVETFTRVKPRSASAVVVNDHSYTETVYYTDSSFFKIFSYEFVEGDATSALKGPHKAVITEEMAHRLFGNSPALGKTIEIGKDKDAFTVTAIVQDDNRSSQFKSKIWLSNHEFIKHDLRWTSAGFYNYVLLKEKSTLNDLQHALDRIIEKQVYPQATAGSENQITLGQYKSNESSVKFYTLPLVDIHLKSKLVFELSPAGNESSMYTFAAISVFILLLASVNFINLTTARAGRRAKEVGIRKAVGSGRMKLIWQFMLESIIVSLAATAISLALAEFFLKAFEFITGDRLLNTLWNSGWSIVILAVFAVFIGIISGIYPALYLTSFNPVKVLKGKLALDGGGQYRNALVIFQFSISVCLIICSAFIFRQMDYMQTKDLGFNQSNMVTIDNIDLLKEKAEAFRNELERSSGVEAATFHTGEPGSSIIMSTSSFKSKETAEGIAINTYFADADFISTIGFRIIKGRDFNKDLPSDSAAVIINESAAEALGLSNPVGAKLNEHEYVIGVVSNFHWESLRNAIAPVAIKRGKDYFQLGFRLNSTSTPEFIASAETQWKELLPQEPFRYHFLDENFGEMIEKEKVFGNAIAFFTTLAIFISCLGLYGLSAFTAEQRTKEIGIRKVLGASASNIVGMLNRKFAFLVALAVCIAVPVSLYLMTTWLEGFAYRIELSAWIVLLSIACGFVVALFTVSFHSLKAALVNPADTLKYE